MCLLIASYNKFPSRELLRLGESQNRDGGGLAWTDSKTGTIKWVKGLQAKDMLEYKNMGAPYIIHFRAATVGGKSAELTHPFPTSLEASNALSGETGEGVLAHNGNFFEWHKELMAVVNEGKHKIPNGRWSDSRALAFLAAVKGPEYIAKVCSTDKIAWLTPSGLRRYGTWAYENKESGIMCSYDPFYRNHYGYEEREFIGGKWVTKPKPGISLGLFELTHKEFIEQVVDPFPKLKSKHDEWQKDQKIILAGK